MITVRCTQCRVTAQLSNQSLVGARHMRQGRPCGTWRIVTQGDGKSYVPNQMREVVKVIRDFRTAVEDGMPTKLELKTFLRDLHDKLDALRFALEQER